MFRKAVDPALFAEECVECADNVFYDRFAETTERIFDIMQTNSFSKLKQPEDSPSRGGAGRRIANILRKAVSRLDERGYCYREIFEGYYLNGESTTSLSMMLSDNPTGSVEVTGEMIENVTEALCELFMEEVDSIYYEVKESSFRELIDPVLESDGISVSIEACDSVLDILLYSFGLLDETGFYRLRDIFVNYYLKGETMEQLAQWPSENLKDYVHKTCVSALIHIRQQNRSRNLMKLAEKYRVTSNDSSEKR